MNLKQGRTESGKFKAYTISELYYRYVDLYEKAEKSLNKYDAQMYVKKLSQREFNAIMISAQNSGIKVNAAYVKSYVDASRFKFTSKQGKALKKAMENAYYERYKNEIEQGVKKTKKFTEFEIKLNRSAKVKEGFSLLHDYYYDLQEKHGAEEGRIKYRRMIGSP